VKSEKLKVGEVEVGGCRLSLYNLEQGMTNFELWRQTCHASLLSLDSWFLALDSV